MQIRKEFENFLYEYLYDIDRSNAKFITDVFFDLLKNKIAQDEVLQIRGFGTFRLARRKAKVVRDIKRGNQIKLKAYNKPIFKPSKEFIKYCNE